MPEDLPDRMPEDMPEDMPEHMPEDMPDRMPDRMPEDMPDRMPEGMPDRMPDKMSDRMPEDLPVTKCINVMVGITRSKVILFHSFSVALRVAAIHVKISSLFSFFSVCCCWYHCVHFLWKWPAEVAESQLVLTSLGYTAAFKTFTK